VKNVALPVRVSVSLLGQSSFGLEVEHELFKMDVCGRRRVQTWVTKALWSKTKRLLYGTSGYHNEISATLTGVGRSSPEDGV